MIGPLAGASLRRLSRRRWLNLAVGAGVALVVVVALVAAGSSGAGREDTYRAGAASLLLLLGLVVAIGLGAPAFSHDADSGHLGLLTASGAGRDRLCVAVLVARLGALVAAVAIWGVALQAGSLALGMGLDRPLAVHTAAALLGLALALLGAAAASTVVGPVAAGIVGVLVHVTAQAVVNLNAAAEQDVIGTAGASVRGLYLLLPRTVTSPMIADLQVRGEAGPAAPRLDINGNLVSVPASGWDTVAWSLFWCLVIAAVAVAAFRRRPLN